MTPCDNNISQNPGLSPRNSQKKRVDFFIFMKWCLAVFSDQIGILFSSFPPRFHMFDRPLCCCPKPITQQNGDSTHSPSHAAKGAFISELEPFQHLAGKGVLLLILTSCWPFVAFFKKEGHGDSGWYQASCGCTCITARRRN